jgi:hypothetical protein
VDCAEAVNANRANAPRKRNFFMGNVLIQYEAGQTALGEPRYKLLQLPEVAMKGFH